MYFVQMVQGRQIFVFVLLMEMVTTISNGSLMMIVSFGVIWGAYVL